MGKLKPYDPTKKNQHGNQIAESLTVADEMRELCADVALDIVARELDDMRYELFKLRLDMLYSKYRAG